MSSDQDQNAGIDQKIEDTFLSLLVINHQYEIIRWTDELSKLLKVKSKAYSTSTLVELKPHFKDFDSFEYSVKRALDREPEKESSYDLNDGREVKITFVPLDDEHLAIKFDDQSRLGELQRMLFMHKEIIDLMSIGVLVWHLPDYNDISTFTLKVANAASSNFTGTDMSKLIGLKVNDAFPGLLGTGLMEIYRDVMITGKPANLGHFEYGDHRVEQSIYALQAFVMPNNCCGVTFENVGDQVKSEAEIIEKSEAISRKNIELEQMAYTLSHDLQAPLKNLEGLIQMFKQLGFVREDNQEIFKRIESSGQRIGETLRGLLSGMTSTAVEEEKIKKIRFAQFFEDILEDLQELIAEASPTFESDFHAAPSIKYYPSHLRSIMQNLVSNALKYRDQERKLKIKLSSASEGDFIILTVEDNGKGISKKNQNKIFQLFQRVDHQINGKGIGLFIVKRQLEKFGGKIEVESTVGQGSTFKIWFKSNPDEQN